MDDERIVEQPDESDDKELKEWITTTLPMVIEDIVELEKKWITAKVPIILEGTVELAGALVLLAAFHMGHKDRDQLAEFTGVSLERVNKFAERLEHAGVWLRDGTTKCNWTDAENVALAFWYDVGLAVGAIKET